LAKEARKLKRAAEKKDGGASVDAKAKRKSLSEPVVTQKPADIADPLAGAQLKNLAIRLGLPLLGVWIIAAFVAGQWGGSNWLGGIALGTAGVLTVLAVGVVAWAYRYARKAKQVHAILKDVESAEDREEALKKLDAKKDVAAVFAKAQLLMQEDPNKALAELEKIDLAKVMAPVGDEARAQRAMIHMMQGDVNKARPLADGIDPSRHQDARTRALMVAVIAEAWARTGQVKKAREKLDVITLDDPEIEAVKPQLYRALAFVGAYENDVKTLRKALKKLLDQDVRLLGGFLMKKTHPLLQKEAKKLVEQSGAVPRKMQFVRH
jgi:tetratricopeptide (TPR) repeat protein